MTKRLFALVLALATLAPACALFAPSKAELMAYCVSDPDVKKAAAKAGVTPEQLCERLLRDEPAAAECDGGDAGSCAPR